MTYLSGCHIALSAHQAYTYIHSQSYLLTLISIVDYEGDPKSRRKVFFFILSSFISIHVPISSSFSL